MNKRKVNGTNNNSSKKKSELSLVDSKDLERNLYNEISKELINFDKTRTKRK